MCSKDILFLVLLNIIPIFSAYMHREAILANSKMIFSNFILSVPQKVLPFDK